ncbi:MAG: hypothetical protein WCE82_10615 [Halobacteriota archaeon]
MKGDEERVFWLKRYQDALAKCMEAQKEGKALFRKAHELDASGAPVDDIAGIVDQLIKLVTNCRKEETTCINELIRLGDVPNIERLTSSYEDRSEKTDSFLTQAILFKDGLKQREN